MCSPTARTTTTTTVTTATTAVATATVSLHLIFFDILQAISYCERLQSSTVISQAHSYRILLATQVSLHNLGFTSLVNIPSHRVPFESLPHPLRLKPSAIMAHTCCRWFAPLALRQTLLWRVLPVPACTVLRRSENAERKKWKRLSETYYAESELKSGIYQREDLNVSKSSRSWWHAELCYPLKLTIKADRNQSWNWR